MGYVKSMGVGCSAGRHEETWRSGREMRAVRGGGGRCRVMLGGAEQCWEVQSSVRIRGKCKGVQGGVGQCRYARVMQGRGREMSGSV